MKCLRKNMTDFEYLPYEGTDTDLNEFGEHTGEYRRVYGEEQDPVPYRGNISAPSGKMSTTFYGDDIRYTHTLVLDNPDADIHEGGVIRWKGLLYDVVAVRPSLNVLSVALLRQTTAHEDPYAGEGVTDGEGG